MPFGFFSPSKKDTNTGNANNTATSSNQSQPASPSNIQNIVGNQELIRLAEEEKFGLTDPEFLSIYETNLYQPLKAKVLYKLGVGRSAMFRSKELNTFRQTMKDAAREQANDDIATHLSSNSSLAGNSNISKELNSNLASIEAYSDAKVSVDSIMAKESDRIIDKLVAKDTAVNQLKQAALATMSSSKLKAEDKKKKATSSAQNKAKELLERFEEPAINEARILVKGDQSSGAAGPNQAKIDNMTKDVKGQVTMDQIGEKAVKKVIEADSVNSGLSKIAPIIDLAVPQNGDSASLSFELKIPIQAGVFVTIGLGAEAEKDEGELSVGANIAVGAGVSAGIAEVAVKLGMFIEANGSNTQSALNLISYGMYRNMNAGFPSLAQRLWGKGGQSGKSSLEEAEIWAAAVEAKELENENNSVSVGQSLTASAEVETGIYSGEFEVSGQRYTKYSKTEFQKIPDLLFGDASETSLDALTQKSTRMNQLKTHKKISASVSTELALPGVDLSFSAEGAITFYEQTMKQLEASISVDLPGEIAGFSGWETIVEKLIPKVAIVAENIKKKITESENASSGQENQEQSTSMKLLQNQLEAKAGQLTAMLSKSSESVDPETEEVEAIVEKDSGLSLNFGLELSFNAGAPTEWEIEFDITKSSSLTINGPLFSLELEKSRKLFSLSHEG